MKFLASQLDRAHSLERDIANLNEQAVTLRAEIESALASGDVNDDKVLDKIAKARGRLELIPVAIEQRERALLGLAQDIFRECRRAGRWGEAQLPPLKKAAQAVLDQLLAPHISNAKDRDSVVQIALIHVDALRPASDLGYAVNGSGLYLYADGLKPLGLAEIYLSKCREYCASAGLAEPEDFGLAASEAAPGSENTAHNEAVEGALREEAAAA